MIFLPINIVLATKWGERGVVGSHNKRKGEKEGDANEEEGENGRDKYSTPFSESTLGLVAASQAFFLLCFAVFHDTVTKNLIGPISGIQQGASK